VQNCDSDSNRRNRAADGRGFGRSVLKAAASTNIGNNVQRTVGSFGRSGHVRKVALDERRAIGNFCDASMELLDLPSSVRGMRRAVHGSMPGATRFEDLLAWQRMHELNTEVWRATDRPPASRNFKFCDQIRDASDSAERNVAEGFGRYSPGQFAHFLDIARASAIETQTLLLKGLEVGYWPKDEFDRLDALAVRGVQAVAKLQRYLRSPKAKRNARRRYR
jgi:four helix bundle protein